MKLLLLILSFVLVGSLASGCATVLTLADRQYLEESHLVYSGIRLDGETFITPFYHEGHRQHWIWPTLAFFDMPLSLVADTVVLPYTFWTYCYEDGEYH